MRRAEFSRAAAALDEVPSHRLTREEALLRARLDLRLGRSSQALQFLARHVARFDSARAEAEGAILNGIAYARLGDDAAATAQFERAARSLPGGDELRFELTYQRAAAAWIARRLDVAEKLASELGPGAPDDVRIQALILRGAIAGSREQLAEQGAHLLQALRRVHAQSDPPVQLWAAAVAGIAYLAREMPSNALRDAAYADVSAVPWTPDLGEYEFTTLRAVGWRHALEGDYFNAFRRLKEAAAAAPNDAWRVTASSDRAYFATVLGERRWAEQELRDAHELAASIAWDTFTREERFALPVLAELTAPIDPSLALSYVARYKEIGGRFSRNLASSDDRRVDALEAYSFATVQLALGERAEAERMLREAWTIYDRIGYDWRAGRCALALDPLTGDASWATRAAGKLTPYTRSWLRATAAGTPLVEAAKAATLTKAQRAVYDLLIQGLSTTQIAASQGRSEYTIRNHIKVIFKAFGVSSRPALIARAVGTAGGRS